MHDLSGHLAYIREALAVRGDLQHPLPVGQVSHDRHRCGAATVRHTVLTHRDLGGEILAVYSPPVHDQRADLSENVRPGPAGLPVAVQVNELLHVPLPKLEGAGGEDLCSGRVGIGDVAVLVDNEHGVAQRLELYPQPSQRSVLAIVVRT